MHSNLTQAWQLHQSGRLAEAERAYRSILGAAPEDVDALNCYGILLMQSKRVEQAFAMFRRAADLMPEHAGIQNNLARAALAVGDPAVALAAAERAIANGSSVVASWQLLGNALKEMNRIDDAIAAFNAGLGKHPDDFPLIYNVAICELMAGRADNAEKTLREIIAARPHQLEAWQGLGNALAALSRLDEAEDAYRRALSANTPMPQCWINLGLVLVRQERFQDAVAAFRQALQAEPRNQPALAALAAVSDADAAALLDYRQILLDQPLPLPARSGQADFNSALAAEILAHPVLQKDPLHKTTRGGFQTGNLIWNATPALGQFVDALRPELDRRMDIMAQRYAASVHPLAGSRPERWRLNLWATVLEHEGHQEPHLHPAGWLSGVYYVALPKVDDNSQAGWIELGRPPAALHHAGSVPYHLHRPETGSLLTFPSYLYHRTLPHASAEPRISLAFDVIPIA